MTRKRFIKLLMSKGFDRNWCEDYAETVRFVGAPYSKTIEMFFKFL